MESWMGWLAVCWHLLLFHFSSSHSLCHPHDSFALLNFKTSLTIDTSISYKLCLDTDPKTVTWENGTDCCSWLGVTCNPISGHVTGLDLTCSWLKGKIHPNSTLFGLSHLTHLNLSFSNFEGEIPPQISHLSRLESLDLSFNEGLKWKESTWKRLLQNATVLRELVLDHTDMSSTSIRPLKLSSSLVTLSLVETRLRGNFTNDILCLPNLQHLYLSYNFNLQSQIPNLSCSASSLRILDLSSCQFQGSIPPSFSNLTHLTSLDLSWNNLRGSIPSSLSNLQLLVFLHLSVNQFSGQIPPFSNLTNLSFLDVSGNNLNGSIPASLLTLPRLTSLSLDHNHLGGQIPNVFHHSNKFERLDLRDNNIEGELPSTLSNLQHLIFLGLSGNKFRGQIPSSLFDLPQLSHLDCSGNQLEGPLPNRITGFSNLILLWFKENLLNGTIPSWYLSLPFLVDLDLSNNQFTGHIGAISSFSLQSLDLCNNKLRGNIPESIFSLVNLTHLCLSSNSLSGPVNFSLFSELQNLESLSLSQNNQLSLNFKSNVNYSFSCLERLGLSSMGLTEFPKLSGKVPILVFLDLSNNKLNGTVPNWLHELDLYYLNLSRNLLTTPIDQFSRNYGLRLRFLDLSFNLFAGDISSSICNASTFEILCLSHNNLTGIIPPCLANLSSLRVLDLQMNKLHGTLPSTFSKNNLLNTLNLNNNQLEGPLPKSLSNCTILDVLNLGNNQIEDTFPHWLQTLPDLKVLILRANKFHGPISSLKSNHPFPSLVILDISSNNFSGQIPKAYIKNFKAMKNLFHDEVVSSLQYMEAYVSGLTYTDSVTVTTKAISATYTKIPTNFVYIDFSNNKFEGGIPNVIGELHAVKGLNLSHNRLSGPIPQSMGNLTNIESLDLSSNMLSGRIPTELTNLIFLAVLNLSHNNLVGEIPQGKQFNTFMNDSYEGNLGLCGVPLSKKCGKDPEQHSPPSLTFWREQGFGFGWKPVAIGYGCGMLFGVGMGCCVLLMGKPQWLVRMVGGLLN